MITARSTTATSTPTPATADPAVAPGKQPLVTPPANATDAARPIASTALPPELAAHAGETFVDGGHYVWRIEPDSSFICIAQPARATKSSIGAKVTQAKSPELWQALCALATESFGAAPAPSPEQAQPADQPAFSLDGFLALLGFGPLPDIGSLVTDLVESLFGTEPEAPATEAPATETPATEAPATEAPTSETPAPEAPAPKAGSPAAPDVPAPEQGGGGAPAALNNVHRCVSRDARLRDETGKELAPKAVVPVSAYVRVVERKTASKPMARVELLSSIDAASGSELGWTNESNLAPLVRAPRPSDPAGQMAAVLAAAKSRIGNEAVGLCYRFVKGHITAAGGYGDILDIYQDERFDGFQGSAVDFAAAVQKHGAAALGLEEVGGAPANAAPGTLLVTRGNGKIRLSEEHGDIAVIGGVERGCIICYNDHRMKLVADPEAWISGDYAGVLVGMYRPIVRK